MIYARKKPRARIRFNKYDDAEKAFKFVGKFTKFLVCCHLVSKDRSFFNQTDFILLKCANSRGKLLFCSNILDNFRRKTYLKAHLEIYLV